MAGTFTIGAELDKALNEFVQEEREKLPADAPLRLVEIDVPDDALRTEDLIVQPAKGGGDYAKGWTIRTKKTAGSVDVVICNKAAPGLTHLLENPHEIKNQFGSYGQTSKGHGQVPHIAEVAERAEAELLRMIEVEM